MRKVKGFLTVVAGLTLLLQAGTSVAFADEGRQRGSAKADAAVQAKSQVGASAQHRSDSSHRSEASQKADSSQRAEAKRAESETGGTPAIAQGARRQASERTVTTSNASSSPAGNNGTLKVHEGAAESQPERANDPKVCDFHLHGFNFDETSSGQWQINGQGRTDGRVWTSGSWGMSDAEGDWRTGVMTLADGHYKVSAWQTTPDDPPGGAKTKVFKIDCADDSTAAGQARKEIRAAISVATDVKGQLDVRISAAQQLLMSGTLSATQIAALSAAINAAITESADLAAAIGAAGAATEQAMADLSAATTAAIQANVNLSGVVNAIASTNANVSSATGTTNTGNAGVTTAGITTAVAGVETTPTMQTGVASAATTESAGQPQGVLGVETLPSTSTGSTVPLAALGTAFITIGAWLLRRPVRRTE
jgi:hypothetical protein